MRTLRSLIAAVLAVVMIACLSVSAFAAYEEITYDDVSEMYNTSLSGVNTIYIKFADKLGIVPSLNDGSFNPYATISRIEALKMAYRMLHYGYDELEEYSSVNTDFDEANGGDITDVYMLKAYIAWAMDYQLINSQYVPDNKFEPNKPITGEEFITLMAKVLGLATDGGTVEEYESAMDIVLMDAEVSADSETINREQAAVVAARAMLFDPEYGDVNEDMYVNFSDYDINCLATNVYGCHNTQLTVRATKQRPMGFNVTSDIMFANGAQVDVGADMSAFVGYQMDIVYMDKDGSKTFTEDEEIITYQMVSPWITTVSLSDVTFESYTAMKATSSQGAIVKLQTNSLLYLNDRLWPQEEIYNLIDLAEYIEFSPNTTTKPATIIDNRPNLEFTFIQQTSAEMADVVLATEWIPGKIMTVTDDYIGVYSYYDGETYVYEDNYIEMTNLVNPSAGDYVDFYIVDEVMHLTKGNTALLNEYVGGVNANNKAVLNTTVNEEKVSYRKHLFYNDALYNVNDLGGRPVVAVLDHTGKSYIALEEPAKTEEIAIEIISATTSDGLNANIMATVLGTGETVVLKDVLIANITSQTGIVDEGSIYTYYETEGGAIYMHGIDPVDMTVIEMDDYFITEGGVKYLKTEDYASAAQKPINGEATLIIDRYNGVRAAIA